MRIVGESVKRKKGIGPSIYDFGKMRETHISSALCAHWCTNCALRCRELQSQVKVEREQGVPPETGAPGAGLWYACHVDFSTKRART